MNSEQLAPVDLDHYIAQSLPAGIRKQHKVLFSGPKGCGKTAAALALAQFHTGVLYTRAVVDIVRVNCASATIDEIRQLVQFMSSGPFDRSAKCKAVVLDELHMLSTKSEAVLLVPVEEDQHNFWAGCTTQVHKVSEDLRSRFSRHLSFAPPSVETLVAIALQADPSLSLELAKKRAQHCDGDIRQLLAGNEEDAPPPEPLLHDARSLFRAACQNPLRVQALLLQQVFAHPDLHAQLCGHLNTASYEVAAHQLVRLARAAKLVK